MEKKTEKKKYHNPYKDLFSSSKLRSKEFVDKELNSELSLFKKLKSELDLLGEKLFEKFRIKFNLPEELSAEEFKININLFKKFESEIDSFEEKLFKGLPHKKILHLSKDTSYQKYLSKIQLLKENLKYLRQLKYEKRLIFLNMFWDDKIDFEMFKDLIEGRAIWLE